MVDLVKKHKEAVTLAIGDGANDVGMIKGGSCASMFLCVSPDAYTGYSVLHVCEQSCVFKLISAEYIVRYTTHCYIFNVIHCSCTVHACTWI